MGHYSRDQLISRTQGLMARNQRKVMENAVGQRFSQSIAMSTLQRQSHAGGYWFCLIQSDPYVLESSDSFLIRRVAAL